MAEFAQNLSLSVKVSILSAGVLLVVGMLTGLWKYLCMMSRPTATAPRYVDIAHRSSLMYSFSCLVVAALAHLSAHDESTNFMCALGPIVYFFLAISTYVTHGILNDTANQLARPHKIGNRSIPGFMVQAFMWSLAVVEIGGVVILLHGAYLGMGF